MSWKRYLPHLIAIVIFVAISGHSTAQNESEKPVVYPTYGGTVVTPQDHRPYCSDPEKEVYDGYCGDFECRDGRRYYRTWIRKYRIAETCCEYEEGQQKCYKVYVGHGEEPFGCCGGPWIESTDPTEPFVD